jgi:hypothetical protein
MLALVPPKLEIAGNLKVIDKTEVGRYVNWRLDQTSDPADAPEGTIYYNKTRGVFRCKIPSGWVDCVNQGVVLPPQDGPWVRIPNLDTGDPNQPTIKTTVLTTGIYQSGWKSYILPRNVTKIRVRGYRGNSNGTNNFLSCGFYTSNFSFSGAINVPYLNSANPGGVYKIVTMGGTPDPPLGSINCLRGSSIYSPCIGQLIERGAFEPITFSLGPYEFDIASLPAGNYDNYTLGGSHGFYWAKKQGTTIIPAGTILYMDMRTSFSSNAGQPLSEISCTFEVMFQE